MKREREKCCLDSNSIIIMYIWAYILQYRTHKMMVYNNVIAKINAHNIYNSNMMYTHSMYLVSFAYFEWCNYWSVVLLSELCYYNKQHGIYIPLRPRAHIQH